MIALTEEVLATAKQNEISLSDAGVSAEATPGSPDLEGAWEKTVCLFYHLFSFLYHFRLFFVLSSSLYLHHLLRCCHVIFFVNLNTETYATPELTKYLFW